MEEYLTELQHFNDESRYFEGRKLLSKIKKDRQDIFHNLQFIARVLDMKSLQPHNMYYFYDYPDNVLLEIIKINPQLINTIFKNDYDNPFFILKLMDDELGEKVYFIERALKIGSDVCEYIDEELLKNPNFVLRMARINKDIISYADDELFTRQTFVLGAMQIDIELTLEKADIWLYTDPEFIKKGLEINKEVFSKRCEELCIDYEDSLEPS